MQNQGRSIQNNMLWNSAGSFTFLICQWLVTVFVARLSPSYDAAGVLALAMAISNIFGHIALYKVRAYQVSDVEKEVSAREYVGFRILTTAAGFILVSIYTLLTCEPSAWIPVILYLVFRIGEVYIDVLHGVDQQNFRMDYCGKSLLLRGILFLVAFYVVFKATGDLTCAILAMIAVTFPVILLDTYWAGSLDDLRPEFTPSRMLFLTKACLPAVVGAVFYIAVATVSRQLLGTWYGDEALGIYASVCTPAVAIQAGASYIYSPLIGVFAIHYTEGDRKAFLSLFVKVTLGIIAVFFACLIIFWFAGEPLLDLAFGPSILPYVYLLFPALVCFVLTAYISFMSDLLIAVRDMRGNLIGNAIGFAVSLPASIACIHLWNMNGVSFAVSIAYAIASAVMVVFLMRQLSRTCASISDTSGTMGKS